MPVEFFQVKLSVQAKGTSADLVPPKILQDLNYRFIIVKEGGTEGILRIEATAAALKKIEKDKDCQKLTEKQAKERKESYPKPKLKQKYRVKTQPQEGEESGVGANLYEVDEQGKNIVDTFQTVRSGFHLIDVPILVET